MLQQIGRHHHVTHLHARADASGHAGHHDGAGAEALDQQRGGGGRRHLADA
jgi:hypothetical protein